MEKKKGHVEPESWRDRRRADAVRTVIRSMADAYFSEPIEPSPPEVVAESSNFRHLSFGFDSDGNYDVREVQDGEL